MERGQLLRESRGGTDARRVVVATALKTIGLLVAACLIIGGDLSGRGGVRHGAASADATVRDGGWRSSNGTVQWLVQARYRADWAVNERRIAVRANRGVVTLTGIVESEQARARAVALAERVRGVTAVENRLEVERRRRLAE